MNRARDFLAGMEEKTAFRACVFAVILVLMAATMFLLNVHTPLQMDDYDYSFSWSTGKPLAGVADVLASQAAHYRLWGGRSVVHTLAQLFLYWGKGVFNIANTAAYMLLVIELYALPSRRADGFAGRFCWSSTRRCSRWFRSSARSFCGWTARATICGARRWRFCRC